MSVTEVRTMVHATWASVAPNWGEYADALDAHELLLTQRMLDGAAISPGERVLELACGPGGVGMAAAVRTGPGGEVVMSDVATEMAAIAATRAQARRLDNVRTTTLDLEDIDEPDASYDVVLCREGLMFAVEPPIAVREIARVLRPGGRAALAVWGPPSANPWLSLVLEAVSAAFAHPVPPPGIPGPFSLTDADSLAIMLLDAGLVDVHVTDVEDVAGPPSTNGGSGRPPSPVRSRPSWPRRPTPPGQRSSNASETPQSPTPPRPAWNCPASPFSPSDGARRRTTCPATGVAEASERVSTELATPARPTERLRCGVLHDARVAS